MNFDLKPRLRGFFLKCMIDKKPSKIFWFLPSVAEIIFIVILAIILSDKGNLLGDADTGYHIRAGEYIIDNLKVPSHDLFSHITPPLEWTAHEWLSEAILALIHRVSGLTGVVVAFALLIAFIHFILLRFLRSSGISIIVSACMVALAAGASIIHWLARPHIFSLLIILVWYLVLDTYQDKRKNYLYLLPPIMLLWVNLHGGFIAGFLLLGIYIISNAITAIFERENRKDNIATIKTLSIFTVICLLASLLNPKGYKILLFPFNLVSNTFIMDHVSEFLSPNFHTDLRFEYMLLLMILVFGFSLKRLNVIEIVLVLVFTHMSLYSARYIPLYAIILSPILGRQIDHLLDEFRDRRLIKRLLSISERTAKTDSMTKFNPWLILTVAVLTFMVFTKQLIYQFDKKKLPVDAVQFMQQEKISGNMFNNDEFGDYIIYAAWPQYKVFFDGRSDMYGTKRLKDYFQIVRLAPRWDEVLQKNHVTWIIFDSMSPLSSFLIERNDWKLIYSDKVANIFVKNIPENDYLIEKYPDVKPVIVDDEEEKKAEK
jgi:hypothetical protein